jgi:protoporphyrinogen oxidase
MKAFPIGSFFKALKKIDILKSGASAATGHCIVRDRGNENPVKPSIRKTYPVVIIGAGVSGLTAGYLLKKSGFDDFIILEMESLYGGNSVSYHDDTLSYPYGAHYLGAINPENKPLIDFLTACGVYENGEPNPMHLCHDPKEKLYYNGEWHNSLLPFEALAPHERCLLQKFYDHVHSFTGKKGNDDRYIFDIPLRHSSRDPQYLKLDKITFAEYLKMNGFQSPFIDWYANYCCMDEYGSKSNEISAWAGLHYYASRRSNHDILTFENGNGFLVNHLVKPIKKHITTNAVVSKIQDSDENGFTIFYTHQNQNHVIAAEKIVMSVPAYIAEKIYTDFHITKYPDKRTPWLVSNLIFDNLPVDKRLAIAWDNVIFDSSSLGFINSMNQSLKTFQRKLVLTHYQPLSDDKICRLQLLNMRDEELSRFSLNELDRIYPDLKDHLIKIDLWVHGHGMCSPVIGRISDYLQNRRAPNRNMIYCHTDRGGISIFEEAFDQGVQAFERLNSLHA